MPDEFAGSSRTKRWRVPVPEMSLDVGLEMIPDVMGMRENTRKMLNGVPMQGTRLSLVLDLGIGKASEDDRATIFVNLENSQISSGKMMMNDNDSRGLYQDRIEVEMWIEESDGSRSKRFRRVSDGPQTANGSSSTSSSVSFSFSESANIGFFGGTPTGGAGVSLGVSDSHSFSRNLSDFRVENTSNTTLARHAYVMSASSGGAYSKATDLAKNPNMMSMEEVFSGIRLSDPPPLATANLELLSMCVWQATSTADVVDTPRVRINVTQRMSHVVGTNNVFSVKASARSFQHTYSYSENLPFGDLAKDDSDEIILTGKD